MNALLKICVQPWTGWTREQPQGTTISLDAQPGDDLILKIPAPLRFDTRLSVKTISPDRITLVTSALSPDHDGRIDLRGNYTDLETDIPLGQSCKLVTQTMDAGVSFEIYYLQSAA